jgi:hypothetical protein
MPIFGAFASARCRQRASNTHNNCRSEAEDAATRSAMPHSKRHACEYKYADKAVIFLINDQQNSAACCPNHWIVFLLT